MKKFILCLKIIYIVTVFMACLNIKTFLDGIMVMVSIILPFVFPILYKFFKKQMPDEWMVMNITFMYFASLIGSCLGGYQLPLYDKFVHFFSGVLVFQIGRLIYDQFVCVNISVLFKDLFCHLFNLSVAVLWEFYEYFMLVVFNHDCIHHYSSGVHDAITDMICAFLGGILVFLLKRKTKFFEKLG